MLDDRDGSLTERLTRITHDLLEEHDDQPTLDRVVQLAIESIPSADECTVSLRRTDGRLETLATTSTVAQGLDSLQNDLGLGPSLAADWYLDTLVIADLASDARWPSWARHACDLGLFSALSLNIDTPAPDTVASLTVYSRTDHAFDHTDVAVASILARQAAYALVVSDHSQLQVAIRSRQLIGAAQGMLMQRYGLTLDQAFEVLRRYSNQQNIRIRDLAQQLVAAGHIGSDLPTTLEGAPETVADGA